MKNADTLKIIRSMSREDFWSAFMQTNEKYQSKYHNTPVYLAFYALLLGRGKDVPNWWVDPSRVETYDDWLYEMHKLLRKVDPFEDFITEIALWNLLQEDAVWDMLDTYIRILAEDHYHGDVILRWPFVDSRDVMPDDLLSGFLKDNDWINARVVSKYKIGIDKRSIYSAVAKGYVKHHRKLYPDVPGAQEWLDGHRDVRKGSSNYSILRGTYFDYLRDDVDRRLKEMAKAYAEERLRRHQEAITLGNFTGGDATDEG